MKPVHALILLPLLLACGIGFASPSAVDDPDGDIEAFEFPDQPLKRELHTPPWFKLSFLDLQEDLKDAVGEGKRGIIVYFGQKHCAYCKQLLEVNWGKPDIISYTRKHFDVIGIDIWGDREVTDMKGRALSEKAYAEREKTNFTPSLLFYDRDGNEALLLRGYYPPYRFRAALEYVADGHYQRMSFPEFLNLAPSSLAFDADELIEEDFFEPPPFALDRSRFPADQPLAVFFEQGDCYACDVLHTDPLQDPRIRTLLRRFQTVQLNFWGDTPVITPAGERTTSRDWAKELGLFYTPSILFYDEQGKEIIRVDSVIRFSRLKGVLEYVLDKGYQRYPTFQRWRQSRVAQPEADGSAR
jgi:thioredoxin-related protein